MVYRIYVEKKAELAGEAGRLGNEARNLLGLGRLEGVRIIDRYDIEGIEEELFAESKWKVFAEPQTDMIAENIEELTDCPIDLDGRVSTGDEYLDQAATVLGAPACVFAVEALPGQFIQKEDSAEQCIQMIGRCERPVVKYAKVYVLYGELMPADIDAVKKYVINPAETREADLDIPETLKDEQKAAADVATLEGFITMTAPAFPSCIKKMGLSMDEADLGMVVDYFRDEEKRDPTLTELKTVDAYWADSVRHTALNTIIDSVVFEDPLLQKAYKDYLTLRKNLRRNKPVTLHDIATIAVRHLRREGRLDKVDESGENKACTVMINVKIDGENEPWLLLFKNSSNNHQTDTGPFSGAAACLDGCIRDTLSGRAYAYSAMRLTGSADPLQPVAETLPGKLPQRYITAASADSFAACSNQAGIATGLADEIYHPGYAADRLEVSAVMAAVPAVSVRREEPLPGDAVMLLGSPAGREAADGAAQKGSPSEDHKLQRFFRNGVATRMIKRCSSVGAGGVCVAAVSLAAGVDIDLDSVPVRCEGLGGTELAVSDSPERMAVVVDAENEKLLRLIAKEENLSCARIGAVIEEPRLVMRWKGKKIADISGEFLAAGGADKHIDIAPKVPGNWNATSMYKEARSFTAAMNNLAQDLNVCSKRGLAERFDSTIGAGAVLMPFGGKNQITPVQAMVHKIPVTKGTTDDCSLMAWGYNPYLTSASPYHGAYLAVVESVARLIASGADFKDIYLSFQEHFASPGREPSGWGAPFAAMLGAFEAQMALGIAAIGNDESFDGSFEGLDVPPALISFAVTMGVTGNIVSPEFKEAGHKVVMLKPYTEEDNKGVGRGLPNPESLVSLWKKAAELIRSGEAVSAYTPGIGGIAEGIMKMTFGNGIGFRYDFDEETSRSTGRAYRVRALEEIFSYSYGSILLELSEDADVRGEGFETGTLGYTTEEQTVTFADESLAMSELLLLCEGILESVFPTAIDNKAGKIENISYKARSYHAPVFKRAEPKVLIPVFPGTNCEYDSERVVREAGGVPDIRIIRNRSAEELKISTASFAAALKEAQMVFIPGGYACGDEPGSAARYIEAFFRNADICEAVTELLDKNDGLICGIGNGFQALIKLGLVPYGRISDTDEASPALTFNTIGSHQSKIARVRIASDKSPWLRGCRIGEVFSVPVSCREGRFIADEDLMKHLAGAGQIATQFADLDGDATGDIRFNPSGSMLAAEGITSPDGRVIGRMGHIERIGSGLYKNVEGNYQVKMFENAVKYFK